ncbi:MAG TPA: AMP-binding protein [Bacteroidales bacterium]|nr:AMP-binding protein [Bacteroidales bacterium]
MSIPTTNLNALFEHAIRSNSALTALSDYGGESFTYGQTGERIAKVHSIFSAAGINPGDHVALLGKNSAQWCMIYLATVTYGAVIVPILPDFKPADIHTIITHSDSLFLYAEESMFLTLDPDSMPLLRQVRRIRDDSVLFSRNEPETALITGTAPNPGVPVAFRPSNPCDLAVISYTSGTTGFSKGVMLQHKSLLGNILYAHRNMPLNPRDRILSFLPLAHTYGCAFEFLFPFTLGCDITFLTKTPSPKIIMQAFGEIRPALILSVPLVIEKIYKSQILPALRGMPMRALIHTPGINKLIYKKIRDKMVNVFGGNFRELVIGGAPFNSQAERFFKKLNFPFTVGYGMTECGPLISYASWKTTKVGASGRVVDELEMRIDSSDPLRESGEILVRGNHVMLGYYQNEEATRAVIDDEGWLHTGDLGVMDRHGNIFIKGRSKSMILGPSGKNIYPEEIESVLNNRFMVAESLVIDRAGRLVALICPDYDAMERSGHRKQDLPEIFRGYIHDLNHHMPKYIRIADFEIREAEFEKTPKKSIKRFLYK